MPVRLLGKVKKRGKIVSRAQAALEFLMTYGWAIMVVLIAISALSYFGVLSPDNFLPAKCFLESGIACVDFRITDRAITFSLRNSKGEDITVTGIKASGCSGTNSGSLKNGARATFQVLGCSNTVNSKYSADLNVTYTSESGLTHKNQGKISGKIAASTPVTSRLSFREDGSAINTNYDAEISASNPTTNYGSQVTLNVDGVGPHAHVLIKFPNIFGSTSSEIPLGAQIDSATLRLDCYNFGYPVNAYFLLEDWTESEVTWNNRDSSNAWSNSGADGPLSRDSNAIVWDCPSAAIYHYDMTNFVQKWSNGTANYGIVLVDTGDNGIDFPSSENIDLNSRPQLNVTFTIFT